MNRKIEFLTLGQLYYLSRYTEYRNAALLEIDKRMEEYR